MKGLFKKSANANKNAKKEQFKTVCVLVFFGLVAVGFYYYSTQKSHTKKAKVAHFSGAFDGNVGLNYDHARIKALTDQLDQTNLKLSQLEKKKAHSTTKQIQSIDATTKKQMESMQKEIQQLKIALNKHEKVEQKSPSKINNREKQVKSNKEATKPRNQQKAYIPQPVIATSLGIEDVSLNYPEVKKEQTKRTSKNYVWAGTFANGYLLTGIIADAGTNSTKNTGTVAIRLTSTGTMPNGKHSHLKNCVVLGSTYGDLSSDSAVIHLETLSCAGKKYSFEKKVYGSVFDLDAMQDLRGVPVLKAKPILGYAAVAGLISGIGEGISSSGQTSTVTGSGVVTTPTNALESGIGQGISKPADKITDYLMDIANIYHPIVVVRAGRKVTVLFQAGFWIDQAHSDFESMKSIDSGKVAKAANQTVESITSSVGIKSPVINDQSAMPDQLTKEVAQASGQVKEIAQTQANQQFNENKLKLGQSLFTPVQGG